MDENKRPTTTININGGSIGQFISGDATINNYYDGTRPNVGDEYITKCIRRVADYMKESKEKIYWSDVYFYMKQKRLIGDEINSASSFGNFVEEHVDSLKAETIRKSGNYQPSTNEKNRRMKIINSLAPLFTGN